MKLTCNLISLIVAGVLCIGGNAFSQTKPSSLPDDVAQMLNERIQNAEKLKDAEMKIQYRKNEIFVKLKNDNLPKTDNLNQMSVNQTSNSKVSDSMINDRKLRIRTILNKLLPGTKIKKHFQSLPDTTLVKLPQNMTVAEALAALKNSPDVEFAEPNYIYRLHETIPDDTHFPLLWNMHNTGQTGGTPDVDIDAPEVWEQLTATMPGGDLVWTGKEVVIGVIDTGINYMHPDLTGKIWLNPKEIAGNGVDDDNNGYADDMHGINTAEDNSDPRDRHGHGTHCAGTIAATGNNDEGVSGISWNAKIIACKAFSGSTTGTEAIVECLDYFYDLKTKAGINLVATSNSWGERPHSKTLMDAIQKHLEEDILFVTSAGNKGTDNDSAPQYPASYGMDNIITVANIDHSGDLHYSSCYGKTSVDLAAPGTNVYSTYLGDEYNYWTGTSMAAPHVVGAVALLKSTNPDMTGLQIKRQLFENGHTLPSLEGKTWTGKMLKVVALTPPDSDGDGIFDDWEAANGLDPDNTADGALDFDSDGLINLKEFSLRTDPNNSDSDNDGLQDGEEVNVHNSNPNLYDSDSDGLSDGKEVAVHGSSPINIDSDSDGLLDYEEILHGTAPDNPDTDNDGVRDYSEIRMYTDPKNSDDFPAVYPPRVAFISGIYDALWMWTNTERIRQDLLKTGQVEDVTVVDKCADVYCMAKVLPSLDELLKYDVVLVGRHFTDPVATGDLLADYSDAGGSVVTSCASCLQGRWLTEAYDALVPSYEYYLYENTDYNNPATPEMVITDTGHPIVNGIESFTFMPESGHFVTHPSEGAVEVAKWSTSQTMIAVKHMGPKRNIGLNFNLISSGTLIAHSDYIIETKDYSGWREESDGGYVIANALQYAAFGDVLSNECNDHDHCTADIYDNINGCRNTAIPGYCVCRSQEDILMYHAYKVRAWAETTVDCSGCETAECSLDDFCAKELYTFYAAGTNEVIGSDPNQNVTLYSIDGVNWSTIDCAETGGAGQTTCVDSGETCAIDSDCCSGKCFGWFHKTCR